MTNITSFIWGIADDVLRDVYRRGKYRDVILPMTVIRRLDAVLEPTKERVLAEKARLDSEGLVNQEAALTLAAGEAFYNASPFTLRGLLSTNNAQRLRADFEAYLAGFSENVRDILKNFEFHAQLDRLEENDCLYPLIEKFCSPKINLSPRPVLDGDGVEILPGLDNHRMGTVFEELLRQFNDENNEEAGEHFTPRDIVDLMARLVFLPVADRIKDGTYLLYDGACGTGGMLTVAEDTLRELARERGKQVSIHLFGQELNGETYAICKADLLLKGEGQAAENIKDKSTLAADGFPGRKFDFLLSNPPFGKSWKTDLEKLGGKAGVVDPRFVVSHAGEPAMSLVTRSSDGQMMFLANMISKMREGGPVPSRIAEIHNGSALFTGDAGGGESNARRWIIENDWLEAIVALPLNSFYNTGIATYLWILSREKDEARRGKVQLIDATTWFRPLPRNLGKKNCELTAADIERVCEAYRALAETEQSKVFPNDEFGYWKIVVERPLRLSADLSPRALARLRAEAGADVADAAAKAAQRLGPGPHRDMNAVLAAVEEAAAALGLRKNAARRKAILAHCGTRDPQAAPVIAKTYKAGEADPVYGLFPARIAGRPALVAYEPDVALRDTEVVPLREEGGIEAFFAREVAPHAPDAWIDEDATKIGYEISFTRYFYKPKPLRSLAEIRADIEALEAETEALLSDIVAEG
ncbi:type I restriction-modification system subunit M [Salinarimonas ramus]|uniref:site-specific DNA-methyltransferase (adenine-specific) n=1 Tax=Salinarimonas ramus TaxID=690164 RepID=A0A917QIR2_9HYPH|nr:class I SAM-dependent DNA methyltransferase [Salinarimonas ramus]GGK51758.1 hypothetical protein GCM10011322_43490 [Salinarimonas ramus]